MTLSLNDIKLAIVGLGYVGLPLAVEFARKRAVVGFDIYQQRIEELRGGHPSLGLGSMQVLCTEAAFVFITNLEDNFTG